jgi:DNA polymerase-3 subunit epsilon
MSVRPGLQGDDLEAMAARLEASGAYRVLRRFVPRTRIHPDDGSSLRTAMMVDLETTGLDPIQDEIIEIGVCPFTYSPDGRIFEILPAFHRLRQPSKPLPDTIKRLTGLRDEDLAGRHVDPDEVAAFIAPADIVIAHNAAFDRVFLERFCDAARGKPWACSMSQAPWLEEGFESVRLTSIAAGFGLFHDAHRAVNDCELAVELLSRRLPGSGRLALDLILEAARRTTVRVYADAAPFSIKDRLKERGYRWSGEGGSRPRLWYRDVDSETAEAEIAWLIEAGCPRIPGPQSLRITAYERFSERS